MKVSRKSRQPRHLFLVIQLRPLNFYPHIMKIGLLRHNSDVLISVFKELLYLLDCFTFCLITASGVSESS